MVGAVLDESGVFTWDVTGLITAEISRMVDDRLRCLPESAAHTVTALLLVGEHRLVAEYLRATAAGDSAIAEACQRIAAEPDKGTLRYELGRLRFASASSSIARLRDSASRVLDATDGQFSTFVAATELLPQFTTLLDDLGSGIARFIENQSEVPGPNARVRQGVVKTWFLPDGTQVASKRENPLKPGRFRRELRAYGEVVHRMGIAPGVALQMPNRSPGDSFRELSVPPIVALMRDGASGRVYSVSRWVAGPTLESILLVRTAGSERTKLLVDYRDLMDALFERGILWGDLSPRNVLVSRGKDKEVFHLVDFEKTEVGSAPISTADRARYCRGQMGVEELGVLCTREEVREVLNGYFDPSEWDLDSTEPVPFPLRPEVAAVLRGRGVTSPCLGLYNQTDLEIFDVRSPDLDPISQARRYPGSVNFRVEHYLSCAGNREAGDYDRKTTEVLIHARRYGCFEEALRVVSFAADALERRFVITEFSDVLGGRLTDGTVHVPHQEVQELTTLLDVLYAAKNDSEEFRTVCAGLAGRASAKTVIPGYRFAGGRAVPGTGEDDRGVGEAADQADVDQAAIGSSRRDASARNPRVLESRESGRRK